jgi:hypothetical protein
MRTGKYNIKGQFVWPYSSNDARAEDWLARWDAGGYFDLTIKLIGGEIPGATPSTTRYTLQFDIPNCFIVGEDPPLSGPGALDQTFSFQAGAASMSVVPFTLTLINNASLP